MFGNVFFFFDSAAVKNVIGLSGIFPILHPHKYLFRAKRNAIDCYRIVHKKYCLTFVKK